MDEALGRDGVFIFFCQEKETRAREKAGRRYGVLLLWLSPKELQPCFFGNLLGSSVG